MADVIDNAGGHRQVRYHDEGDGTFSETEASHLRAWDATSGTWVRVTVDHTSGGLLISGGTGGGGAATIADGADVAQGTTTDASSANTVVGILKAIKASLAGALDVSDRVGRLLGVVSAPVGTPVFARLSDGAAAVPTVNNADADIARVGLVTDARNRVWNGATWDRLAGGTDGLVIKAAVAAPVFVRLSDGTVALVGSKVSASSLPVVIASDQAAVPVTAPALTKGTQGANGFTVQELKDAGRVNIVWTAEFAHAQAAETLLTLTESRDGAASTTASSKVVTNGKRLRITSIAMEVESLGTGTTPQRAYLRCRFNTAGAATTASALNGVWGLGVTSAIVKATEKEGWQFPDGIEFLGDGTKQIGFSLETPDWVVTTATGRTKVTITAFEY